MTFLFYLPKINKETKHLPTTTNLHPYQTWLMPVAATLEVASHDNHRRLISTMLDIQANLYTIHQPPSLHPKTQQIWNQHHTKRDKRLSFSDLNLSDMSYLLNFQIKY